MLILICEYLDSALDRGSTVMAKSRPDSGLPWGVPLAIWKWSVMMSPAIIFALNPCRVFDRRLQMLGGLNMFKGVYDS